MRVAAYILLVSRLLTSFQPALFYRINQTGTAGQEDSRKTPAKENAARVSPNKDGVFFTSSKIPD
jgi:hypothetical protein